MYEKADASSEGERIIGFNLYNTVHLSLDKFRFYCLSHSLLLHWASTLACMVVVVVSVCGWGKEEAGRGVGRGGGGGWRAGGGGLYGAFDHVM